MCGNRSNTFKKKKKKQHHCLTLGSQLVSCRKYLLSKQEEQSELSSSTGVDLRCMYANISQASHQVADPWQQPWGSCMHNALPRATEEGNEVITSFSNGVDVKQDPGVLYSKSKRLTAHGTVTKNLVKDTRRRRHKQFELKQDKVSRLLPKTIFNLRLILMFPELWVTVGVYIPQDLTLFRFTSIFCILLITSHAI